MEQMQLTFEMVQEAAKRLRGVAQHTSMPHMGTTSEQCGCNVYLKLENLQRTGSFKLRGAYNKVASLPAEDRARGIVASSAGNHAQGVAFAARIFKAPATICMPATAPLSKVKATKSYGADVVLHGDFYSETYQKALELEQEQGLTFCHPFNDPYVIAGQGTIALEILEDLPETDVIVVPIGGGGLIAGIAFAAKYIKPSIRIVGVQTSNMPSMKVSVEEGKIVTVPSNATLADGIAVGTPGDLTYELVKVYVDEIVTVTEEEIAEAILSILEANKLVTEGAGACPIAALKNHKVPNVEGKKVVALVSGGNIDVNMVSRIIDKGLVQSWRKVFLDVVVKDRPGILTQISELISSTKANILAVHHDRTQRDTPLGQVHVSFEIETFDEEHIKCIMKRFASAGIPAIVK